jgi:hypothetical protein
MRQLYDDFVGEIKKHLPNAVIVWDISPWISEDAMRTWCDFYLLVVDF